MTFPNDEYIALNKLKQTQCHGCFTSRLKQNGLRRISMRSAFAISQTLINWVLAVNGIVEQRNPTVWSGDDCCCDRRVRTVGFRRYRINGHVGKSA